MSGITHHLRYAGTNIDVGTRRDGDAMELTVGDRTIATRCIADGPGRLVVDVDGRHERGVVHIDGDRVLVSYQGRTWVLERAQPGVAGTGADAGGVSDIESPMTGTVLDVLCKEGDAVDDGTPLIVVEAMKMEHRLKATGPAQVSGVLVEAGQQVDIGQVLIRLEPLA